MMMCAKKHGLRFRKKFIKYINRKNLQFDKLSIEFGLFLTKEAIIHKNRRTNDELIHLFHFTLTKMLHTTKPILLCSLSDDLYLN